MFRRGRYILYVLVGVLWMGAVARSVHQLWRFDGTPGAAAQAPAKWPLPARVKPSKTLPTLLVLIHPHCPCSRATVSELARLMTQCQGKVDTKVIVVKPAGVEAGWDQTGLAQSAAAIPGVSVITDCDGDDCRAFGAQTSGQALLYDIHGKLIFSGGITESRGHCGDNDGRSAIVALVCGTAHAPAAGPLTTNVYGCPLLDDAAPGKESRCRK